MMYKYIQRKFKEATLTSGVIVVTSEEIPAIVALNPYNENIYAENSKRDHNFMPFLCTRGGKETFFFMLDKELKLIGSITVRPLEQSVFAIHGDDSSVLREDGLRLSFAQISVNRDMVRMGLATRLLKAMSDYYADDADVRMMLISPLEGDGRDYLFKKGRFLELASALPFPLFLDNNTRIEKIGSCAPVRTLAQNLDGYHGRGFAPP